VPTSDRKRTCSRCVKIARAEPIRISLMIWIHLTGKQMPRRWEHHTTDDTLSLDIRVLQRSAQLRRYWSRSVHWTNGHSKSSVGLTVHDGMFATISYADGTGGSHLEVLDITWTRPNFGGERPWWKCPKCCRRCAIVYTLGMNPFVCRLCASLTYVTAQTDGFTRATRKSLELQKRLGWELGAPFPSKPKGMHWPQLRTSRSKSGQIRLMWGWA
jgi:hypothetical protein